MNKVMCFRLRVENSSDNELFEMVLSGMMIPVQEFDEDTNIYTVHITFMLWKFLKMQCKWKNVKMVTEPGFRKDFVTVFNSIE